MLKLATALGPRGLQLVRMAGAGMRLARCDEPTVADHARRFVAQSMGRLKGLPQKVGQILSMGDAEAAGAFESLAGAAEPLPFAAIEPVLAREWKRPWREVLAALEPAGLAASLGQVHRGRLHDGRAVAVKVQYPGIARAVQADLKLLGWLALPLGGFGRQFNLAGYREELLRDLLEELDYRNEAENQHQYAFLARYQPGLRVPALHGALCTPSVLVCDWEDGETLAQAAQWPEPERKAAARLFLEHALGFFRHGFVHADPHPGNFRFRRTANGVELLLYDFGCIFRAGLATRLALLQLIRITEENGTADPFPLFVKLGFNADYLEPLAERLPALCRVLFEPFIVGGPYAVAQWRLGERVADILGDERWNFRIAGPPQLIFLIRVFHGLVHALRVLDVPVPWKFLLEPIRAQFDAQAAALALDVPARAERGFGRVAKHLKIHVLRDGCTAVKLTSPLRAIDELELLMGDELAAQVRSQGVDLDAIVQAVRRSGYCPQQVFRLVSGDKDVRVWLE
jgi:predicted unusual protein kinase regulating ubiquinone biosynthesis (AarF/ABC1/UbiB family)